MTNDPDNYAGDPIKLHMLALALAVDRATRHGVPLVMRHTQDKSRVKIELGPFGEAIFYPCEDGSRAYAQAASWVHACLDSKFGVARSPMRQIGIRELGEAELAIRGGGEL